MPTHQPTQTLAAWYDLSCEESKVSCLSPQDSFSCGDLHCPQCTGAKRADWLDSTRQLLLPGVTYFQVVFTIPDLLSSLALGNREEMYNLLFRAAWKTLKDVIGDDQLFEAAAVMVLHTWNQTLEAHAHSHAMVPGGGPALNGDRRWIKMTGNPLEREMRMCQHF